MNMRRTLSQVFLLILGGLIAAESSMAQSSACALKPVWIVFVNGIQNAPDDASSSGRLLEERHSELVGADEPTQYALAYNPSGTLGRDVLEAAYQSLPQYGAANLTEFFETLFGLRPANEVFQSLLRLHLERLAILANIPQEAAAIRSAHASIYRSILDGNTGQGLAGEAGGIVSVAHSQGNLFANLTYGDISDSSRLRVVSVATPDDHVGGGGPYFTAQEDVFAQGFIAARQAAGLGVLLPNTSLGSSVTPTLSNSMGHSFELAYLQSPATELEIISAVESARQSIGYEPQDPEACEEDPPANAIIVPVRTDGRTLATFQCTGTTPTCPPWVANGDSQVDTSSGLSGVLHAQAPAAMADLNYTISIQNSVDEARLTLDIWGAMGGIGHPVPPPVPNQSGQLWRYPYTEAVAELLSEYLITLPPTPPGAHSQIFWDITSTIEANEVALGTIFSHGGNEPGGSEYSCRPLGSFGPQFDTPGTIDVLGSNGSGSYIKGPGTHRLSINPLARVRLRSGLSDTAVPRYGNCRFTARVDIRIYTNHLPGSPP